MFSTDPLTEAFGITVETGLDPFTSAAQQATQALTAQIPVLGQFGSGLMSVLASLAGGGGGGGDGFMQFLKMGLSIAGSAIGGGMGGGSLMDPTSMGFMTGIGGMSPDAIAGSVLFGGGFDKGGFTGSGPDDKVMGAVHANEFVLNAGAVQKWGLAFLKKLNSGSFDPKELLGVGAAEALGGSGGGLGALGGGLVGAMFSGGEGGDESKGPLSSMLGILPHLLGFKEGGFTGHGYDDQIKGFVHANEWVVDAPTTRQYRPLLETISAGRIPNFEPSAAMQEGGRRSLSLHFGNLSFPGARDDRSMRRSARQFTASVQRQLSYVNRAGLNR